MKLSPSFNISRELCRMIRESAGSHNNCPIKIIPGDSKPSLKGEKPYYKNSNGDKVKPSKAKRSYWKNLTYVPSSLCVEVGADWILGDLSWKKITEEKLSSFK